jgi:hypothetical protein
VFAYNCHFHPNILHGGKKKTLAYYATKLITALKFFGLGPLASFKETEIKIVPYSEVDHLDQTCFN